jgi:hypothetical protein
MDIDYLVLAFDLCQITFSLAAHAHQIQAHDDVEDLDRHVSLTLALLGGQPTLTKLLEVFCKFEDKLVRPNQ